MRNIKRVKWNNIISAVLILIGIWLFASLIDTNAHNNVLKSDYGQFAKWNAFVNIINE